MRRLAILTSVFVLTSAARAGAADVSVYSNTLVGGRPDLVDGQVRTVVPLYQLVGVRAKNIEVPGFSSFGVAVDAWGGLTLPNSASGNLAAGDVNLAYVDAGAFKNRLRLRLGRQFVVGGVARAMYFDGLYAEYRSVLGIGLSAFTGIPVERRFGNYVNPDFVVGTRAYFAPTYATEVGASFIHAMNTREGAIVRQDAGLDLRWKPFRFLDVSGAFVWSIADARLSEFDIGPRWRPHETLEVLVNYRRTAPDLFLPRTSIFTVFTDQSRDEAGGTVSWAPKSWTRFFADGRAIWLSGELGMEVGARAQLQPFRSPLTTLVAQYRRLQIPSNGFHQARIGARHTTGYGIGLSVDLETYVLDNPVRGQTLSFSASASATYTINKSWFVAATVFAATTPTFESRYEAIAKLTWLFPDGGHLR